VQSGETLERTIDPLVPVVRVDMPAYGSIALEWTSASVPSVATGTSCGIVVRSVGAARDPFVLWPTELGRATLPVVRPGDYTVGFELHERGADGSPARWTAVRPPVSVRVEADRTAAVTVP
jgi:hypothetical protein